MTAMHGTVYYVAPEVMDGKYNEKCDLWSIGELAQDCGEPRYRFPPPLRPTLSSNHAFVLLTRVFR